MSRRQPARRASFRVVFGEGYERWSLSDPGHDVVANAQHHVRYDKPRDKVDQNALVLADVAADFAYLVHTCPSTKLACEKLAALRAAVRDLEEETNGDDR